MVQNAISQGSSFRVMDIFAWNMATQLMIVDPQGTKQKLNIGHEFTSKINGMGF